MVVPGLIYLTVVFYISRVEVAYDRDKDVVEDYVKDYVDNIDISVIVIDDINVVVAAKRIDSYGSGVGIGAGVGVLVRMIELLVTNLGKHSQRVASSRNAVGSQEHQQPYENEPQHTMMVVGKISEIFERTPVGAKDAHDVSGHISTFVVDEGGLSEVISSVTLRYIKISGTGGTKPDVYVQLELVIAISSITLTIESS